MRRLDLEKIYNDLLAEHGPQKCFLNHETPFQLLIATILSAQCTDKTVNSVTPVLFQKYSTPENFANAKQEEIERIICVCGFFHSKAAHIIAASKDICKRFDGKIPETMEDLTSLPGVGRKTANVVLGDALGIPGLPVDTHVIRLSRRIGWVNTSVPEKIEKKLCDNLSPDKWAHFSHLLIIHGRTVCKARQTNCETCVIRENCKTGKTKCH